MSIVYRPEIDGLRAIAIGAVILYHAQINIFGFQLFRGGFIGVDIFFVISGYLITSIILKELVTTGSFSFKNFYERRVRRILPALLFVMLVSLPFAWMYLLPNNFVDFSKSILYSLGFSSNFYFHYSGQQYGAESGLFKPFLHTWSLSVEEQYYILFPIVLLIIFKYFRKYLIHILIFAFVVSLGLADWGSRNHPSFNFYVLPTRVWELLAGSILAYFEIRSGHRSKHQALNLILPTIGLLLISHSILFFDDKMFHPSFYTLSPIIGVCLIIWFSNLNEITTKVLSTKLFVSIGLISYSLYLWHWPIFSFYRINSFYILNFFSFFNLDFINFKYVSYLNKLVIIFLLFFFSIISYFLIEKKFRGSYCNFKNLVKIILLFYIIIIGFTLAVIYKDGFINRLPELFKKNTFEFYPPPFNLLKDTNGITCLNKLSSCQFNITAKDKIFLIGDSHMLSLSYNLKDRVVDLNYQFIVKSIDSMCIFKDNREICKESIIFDKKKDEKSIIILGGDINDEVEKLKDFEKEFFIKKLEELSKNNKIILVYPIPNPKTDVPSSLFRILSKKKNLEIDDYITTSFLDYKKETKSTFYLLDKIKNENIYRVYPHKLFCNTIIKNKCIANNNVSIFYSDNNHPSKKAAEMINDLIMMIIKKPSNIYF
jgi:peptidoglycan/LPS O-acetylase OafA/YrhL